MAVIFIDCEYFNYIKDTDEYKCGSRTDLVLTVDEYGKVPIFCPDCPKGREACSQSIDVKSGSVIQVAGMENVRPLKISV